MPRICGKIRKVGAPRKSDSVLVVHSRILDGNRDITRHEIVFFQFDQIRENCLTISAGQKGFKGYRFFVAGFKSLVDGGEMLQSF